MNNLFFNIKNTIKEIKKNGNLSLENLGNVKDAFIYLFQYKISLNHYNIFFGLDESNLSLINLEKEFGDDLDKYNILENSRAYKGDLGVYIAINNTNVKEFHFRKKISDVVEEFGFELDSLIYKEKGFCYMTDNFKEWIKENPNKNFKLNFKKSPVEYIETNNSPIAFLDRAKTKIIGEETLESILRSG